MPTTTDIVPRARALFQRLHSASDAERTALADDVLLYLYDLRDHYQIAKSTSPRFSGRSFSVLADVIYGLESRPDEVMAGGDWFDLITDLLKDISLGRIVISQIS